MAKKILHSFKFEAADDIELSGNAISLYFRSMLHLFGYANLVSVQNKKPIYTQDVEGLYNFMKINYEKLSLDSAEDLTVKIHESDTELMKLLKDELAIKVSYLEGNESE